MLRGTKVKVKMATRTVDSPTAGTQMFLKYTQMFLIALGAGGLASWTYRAAEEHVRGEFERIFH